MSLKNSSTLKEDNQGQRIKVSKRRETINMGSEQPGKRSMNIAQAFQHEKAMAQTYREKNQRNIMKCKFLYNKLTTLGNLQGVPEMIASQVSQIDTKIRDLEHQIQLKRSGQMKKLRKKVSTFLQQLNFQIQPEDMQKLDDEIELILFLIDIFQEKFNEMTAERKEINEIIARLQKENESDLNAEYNELRRENERMVGRLVGLENQVQRLRSEDHRKLEAEYEYREKGSGGSGISEEVLAAKNIEIERQMKKIEDLQSQLSDLRAKHKLTETDLQRLKRQQIRLKQRFKVMQTQKNQRIKLLQESFNRNGG